MKTKEAKKLQDLVVFHEAELVNEANATLLVGGVGACEYCGIFCQCNSMTPYCQCNGGSKNESKPIVCRPNMGTKKTALSSDEGNNDDDGFLIHL